MREAAYALGAPQWKTVLFVTLRAAKAGVVTGIILAVARIVGETAPLLFTALNNQFLSNMNQPMANLPVVIFQFAMSPYEDWHTLAWAGSLLIGFFCSRPQRAGAHAGAYQAAALRAPDHKQIKTKRINMTSDIQPKIAVRDLKALLRKFPGAERNQSRYSARQGYRIHWPVRLRQVHAVAHV